VAIDLPFIKTKYQNCIEYVAIWEL